MKIIRYVNKYSMNNPSYGIVKKRSVFECEGDILSSTFKIGKYIDELSNLVLLSPCQPSKIICIAINFPGIDHFSFSMLEPLVFIKPPTCICGHEENIINPFSKLNWWGEAELAVVIKKRLKNINQQDLKDGVLGFTIANDVTVENIEERDHHLARSKCPDKFCSVGPWIDTEFDATNCLIEAVQNGEVIRRGKSSDHFWKWQRIIVWLSTWITLEPWDLILTGNPPDTVGMRYLNHGDKYVARISGLGELSNNFFIASSIDKK